MEIEMLPYQLAVIDAVRDFLVEGATHIEEKPVHLALCAQAQRDQNQSSQEYSFHMV